MPLTINGNIEQAIGGDGNDTLVGGALGNALRGGRGNDNLDGGAGSDWVEGGLGNDTLTGGEGYDLFGIGRQAGAMDTITDFDPTSGMEKLMLYLGEEVTDFTQLVLTQVGSDVQVPGWEIC